MVLSHGFPSSNSVADFLNTSIALPPLYLDAGKCSEGLELREGGSVVATATGEGCRSGRGCCVAVGWSPSPEEVRPFTRAEFVVEQVGLQVGFGLMLKNVGSDLRKLTSYPHCWEGGVALLASGKIVANNRIVGDTGLGYGTFENGDRVVLERAGEGDATTTTVHRIRLDRSKGKAKWFHLATLPSETLVGGGALTPYLLLSGLGSKPEGAARVRCVRSALPPWRPQISYIFPPAFDEGVTVLRMAWARKLPSMTEEVLIHLILPFCGPEWFAEGPAEEEELEEEEVGEAEEEEEEEGPVHIDDGSDNEDGSAFVHIAPL
jgi:hypothetical protein